MKILYAATMSRNDSSLYRLRTLQRLGHHVVPFEIASYVSPSPLMRKIAYRLAVGPWVNRLNRELLQITRREPQDVLWCDKLLWLWPETLDKMRTQGVVTISYVIDNPFGPRGDPGWRLYMKDIPHYDLHVVQRDRNVIEYKKHGARHVIKIQTAYDPTIHFPPPPGWSDKNRDREVSFIGTPYDNRAEFLTRLWKRFELPIAVSGNFVLWKTALGAEAMAEIFRERGELFGDQYREGIWRSKINLSFITHSNLDEFAHKSFEIAGCGGFLLAERSAGHMQRFREDREAVFFSTIEECAEKIRRYLPDAPARERIAAAGCARALRDGYHNDRQVGLVVERAEQLVAQTRLEMSGKASSNASAFQRR